MYSLKKKLAVALSGVLTLAMLAPIAMPSVAKAADPKLSEFGVNYIDAEEISIISKVFVDTMKGGKVKSTEVYDPEKVDCIDLGYLNGKAAELQVYKDAKTKLTVKVEAQPKVKATFNATDNTLEVKKGSETIKDPEDISITSRGKKLYYSSDINLKGNNDFDLGTDAATKDKIVIKKEVVEALSVKGATLYVTVNMSDSVGDIGDPAITGSSITIIPESKTAKVKIAAMPKAPKVTLDVNAVSFKIPKGCAYSISKVGNDSTNIEIVSKGAATKAETISIAKVITGASMVENKRTNLTKNDVFVQVWKAASGKKPASKIRELTVPSQRAVSVAEIGSKASFYYEPKLAAKETKQTGIIVKNATKVAIMVAFVDDVSKIDTADKKTAKWTTIKEGKPKVFPAKKVDGKYIVYRYAGVTEKEAKKNSKSVMLASEYVDDGKKIEISKGVEANFAVAWGTKENKDVNDGSASKAAINITPKKSENGDSYSYRYKVVDKAEKKYPKLPIGKAAKDFGADKQVEVNAENNVTTKVENVKAGQVVIVYESKNGVVVAYGASSPMQ